MVVTGWVFSDEVAWVAARAGRVFVTGASTGTNSGRDYATVAYDG